MKYKILVPVICLMFLLPMVAYGFSFKNWFWGPPAVFTKAIPKLEQLAPEQKKTAEAKFELWELAFDKKKDITLLMGDKNNFVASLAEINYMITSGLIKSNNPAFMDVKIELGEGQVDVSGYCLERPFTGEIKASGKFVSVGTEVQIKFTKVTWRGWPLPMAIVNPIVKKNMVDFFNFLYSYPSYQGLDVMIDKEKVEIKYR